MNEIEKCVFNFQIKTNKSTDNQTPFQLENYIELWSIILASIETYRTMASWPSILTWFQFSTNFIKICLFHCLQLRDARGALFKSLFTLKSLHLKSL